MDSFAAARTITWHEAHQTGARNALLRAGKRAWMSLPAALLEPRYQLRATEHSFGESETAAEIQGRLPSFGRSHLIAHPQAEHPCYDITDYVKACIAGDLSVADRLRGRTLIHLHPQEQETGTDDLLDRDGVSRFIERVLVAYLRAYGKQHLIGFTCELPRFLSLAAALEQDPMSVPWSPTLAETTTSTFAAYLPLIFYETYNSAAVRNRFWQELTTRFATCFLRRVREFCHAETLGFGLTLPASAKALEFELGALLSEVDCPILNATEIDTPKRFVVAKWVCSHSERACISRKTSPRNRFSDASFGFNVWTDAEPTFAAMTRLLSRGSPKRPLLMLAPTQSFWTKPDKKQWNRLTKTWGWLCESLWVLGYDFRIISEAQLATAEVVKSGLRFPGDQSVYNVILLPSCLSLQEESVASLTAFTKARGRLIADNPVPYLLNGGVGLAPYPLERLIYGRRTALLRGPADEKFLKLRKHLRKWVEPPVSVYLKPDNVETDQILCQHRIGADVQIFYLFSSGSEPIDGLVEFRGEHADIVEWDPFKDQENRVDFWHANGQTYLNTLFKQEQGRIFVVSYESRYRPLT